MRNGNRCAIWVLGLAAVLGCFVVLSGCEVEVHDHPYHDGGYYEYRVDHPHDVDHDHDHDWDHHDDDH